MLPLWIIDITQPSKRRSHFGALIGKLSGVVNQGNLQTFLDSTDSEGVYVRKKQWYYSIIENTFSEVDPKNNEEMADAVYRFQEKVVEEGQKFVKMLRHANVDSSTTLNVCIIADITERLTQYVFPSMAVMLQKEKERILPNHIHQGMAIVGMPYLPSNVNNLDAQTRQAILLTIKEISIQHDITAVRGYDRMFFYQDVQNRTENYYPQLDETGVAEYLSQCLIHLYYACDKVHPLINGGSSDERFYFSLGVSSIFFDTEVQDQIDNRKVCNSIIKQFKEKGEREEEVQWDTLIDFTRIDPHKLVERFTSISFDVNKAKLEEPSPHPIGQFLGRKLKRLYFDRYLKYYPANLRLKQLEVIADESENTLMEIAAIRKQMQRELEESLMPLAIEKQILNGNASTGILPQIVENLKSLKIRLGKMKVQAKQQIEGEIWQQLSKESVPHNMSDYFDAYHDAYVADCSSKTPRQCQEMKDTALADFCNTLKQEPTFAGRISRAFFMGITLAMVLVPYEILNNPDAKPFSGIAAAFLFLVPLVEQMIELSVYHHKRKIKERKLTAYFLHDAYARITNRIQNEMNYLYDNFIALCDEYIKRCKMIETEIHPCGYDDIYSMMEFPVTQFNQPIIDGAFCQERLIPGEKDECEEIYVNRVPTKINQLDEEDNCILIHQYKQTMMGLFERVRIPQKDERRFDESLGYYVFITQQEKEEAFAEMWGKVKEDFKVHLSENVKKDTLPRRNPTIGEKLRSYANKYDKWNLLEPPVKFAATNGELTCSSDRELADVKCNLHLIHPLLEPFLPKNTTQFQFDEHKSLFEKYLFITRWRTFDSIALNRVLPTEDFDPEVMNNRVNKEEQKQLTNKPSSYILWAMCKEDNSKEWLKLFDATLFNEARRERDIYRNRLNTKD